MQSDAFKWLCSTKCGCDFSHLCYGSIFFFFSFLVIKNMRAICWGEDNVINRLQQASLSHPVREFPFSSSLSDAGMSLPQSAACLVFVVSLYSSLVSPLFCSSVKGLLSLNYTLCSAVLLFYTGWFIFEIFIICQK